MTKRLAPITFVWLCILSSSPQSLAYEEKNPVEVLDIANIIVDYPKEPFTDIVIIVPGSGDLDENGNASSGFIAPNLYRQLSENITSKSNMLVVRYKKADRYLPIRRSVVALDALATEIRNTTKVRCVWLLGHSEGGIVALSLAKRRSDICGVILAGVPGEEINNVIRKQHEDIFRESPFRKVVQDVFSQLDDGHKVATRQYGGFVDAIIGDDFQNWYLENREYCAKCDLELINTPVMYIYGQFDKNVAQIDSDMMCKSPKLAQCVKLEYSNHFFKRVSSGNNSETIRSYTQSDSKIDADFVDAVVQFVKTNGSLTSVAD